MQGPQEGSTMRRLHLLCCVIAAASLWACERTVSTTEQTVEPATCFNCHSDQDTRLVAAEQRLRAIA